MDLAFAGVGFVGTKLTGNFVNQFIAPMLGGVGDQPLMRMAVKAGTAYLFAWGWEVMMRDKRNFTPIFLGGAMSVVEDIIATYIAPTFPMLAGDNYGVYPHQAMGVYPQLGQHYPYVAENPEYGSMMGAEDVGGYQTVV